jgi:hypothetical protein
MKQDNDKAEAAHYKQTATMGELAKVLRKDRRTVAEWLERIKVKPAGYAKNGSRLYTYEDVLSAFCDDQRARARDAGFVI